MSTAATSECEPQPHAAAAIPVEVAQPLIASPAEESVTGLEGAIIEPAAASTPEKRKRKGDRAAMKARRADLPQKFAAGERWKRRLPKACW